MRISPAAPAGSAARASRAARLRGTAGRGRRPRPCDPLREYEIAARRLSAAGRRALGVDPAARRKAKTQTASGFRSESAWNEKRALRGDPGLRARSERAWETTPRMWAPSAPWGRGHGRKSPASRQSDVPRPPARSGRTAPAATKGGGARSAPRRAHYLLADKFVAETRARNL